MSTGRDVGSAPGRGFIGGFMVERVISATAERTVVIAWEPEGGSVPGGGPEPGAGSEAGARLEPEPGGARRLVSRVPWEPGHRDPGLEAERVPWDLPLIGLRPDGDEALLIVEALPDGARVADPGTRRDPGAPGAVRAAAISTVPRFAADLARRVAEAHARGETAGPLHPGLVFALADGRLAGTAQRILRARLPASSEGRTPLFATRFWTPAELRREDPTPADDVFRLASMTWAWLHGAPPFGSGMDELGAVLGGPAASDLRPGDDVDRLLVAAFDPDPAGRPSAADLAAAIGAAAGR